MIMKLQLSRNRSGRRRVIFTLVAAIFCAATASSLLASIDQKRNQRSTRIVSNRSTRNTAAFQTATSAIDFELTDLAGKQVKLSDYRGKVVLVNFWATWCGPCQYEIPIFVELKRKFHKRGLEVIGISMDEGSQEQMVEFVRQYEINYPVVMGAFAKLDAFGQISDLPTSFIIDRNGRIHSRHQGLLGLNEIERQLPKLLKAK
jgi:peroxiredoxin